MSTTQTKRRHIVNDNGSLGSQVRLPFDPTRAKGTAYQTGVWTPMVVAGAKVNPLNSGKDVYCEKPLTHNIHEAVEVMKAVANVLRHVVPAGSADGYSVVYGSAAALIKHEATWPRRLREQGRR